MNEIEREVELEVGDTIVQRFGPYQAKATVVAITDAGAVLEHGETAVFVGYPGKGVVRAPDGTELTVDPAQGFLGRAHWPDARRVS